MARMLLDEKLGYRLDYIEHQLAHVVKDGLAVEGEGVLVQVRQVVRLWSSEATRFWCGYFLGFRSVFHKTSKPHPTT